MKINNQNTTNKKKSKIKQSLFVQLYYLVICSLPIPIMLSLNMMIFLMICGYIAITFFVKTDEYCPVYIKLIAQITIGALLISFSYATFTELDNRFSQVYELFHFIVIYIIPFCVFSGIIYTLINYIYRYFKR